MLTTKFLHKRYIYLFHLFLPLFYCNFLNHPGASLVGPTLFYPELPSFWVFLMPVFPRISLISSIAPLICPDVVGPLVN